MNEHEKEKEWHIFEDKFAVKAENIYADNAKNLPVVVLIHKKTGEIKMFARKMAEEIGFNNLQP